MRRIDLVVAAAAIFWAAAADARVEFTLVHEGRQVKGGEVCFFPSGPVVDPHPSSYWFFSNDVRCHSADLLFDLPSGRFHYFVRHKDGFISRFKASLVSERATSAESYHRVTDEVYPATRIDLTSLRSGLAVGESLAFLTADSDQHLGTIFPVPNEVTEILLPVDWPVIPMVIRDHMPVRVGSPTVITDSTTSLEIRPPSRGTGDVMGWIDVDLKLLSEAAAARGNREQIEVILTAGANKYVPVVKTRHPRAAYAGLQIFRNVPLGPAVLELRGPLWQPHQVAVTVGPGVLTVASPLRAKPAGAVRITYALPPSAVPLAAGMSSTCDSQKREHPGVKLGLYRCANDANLEGIELAASCSLTREARVEETKPDVEVTSLTPGTYVVEITDPALSSTRRVVQLQPLEDLALTVEALAFPIFGRVTRRGKPVRATLKFLGASRFERTTVTDDQGRYETLLATEPLRYAIDVSACDDSFEYAAVPATVLVANQAFDIEVPGTALVVNVVDSTTRRPLPRARARVSIFSEDERNREWMGRSVTEQDGRAEFNGVQDGRMLEVCASLEDYQSRCLDLFQLSEDEEKTVTVALTKRTALKGRLLPSDALDHATIFWVNEAGQESEVVRADAEGRFQYTKEHTASEYVIVASTNRPLFLIDRWRQSADGELIIEAPLGLPSRSLRVSLDPKRGTSPRHVTVAIRDRVVPTRAFDFHLMNRGVDPMLKTSLPLQIRDIAAAGPIAVVIGPSVAEVPPGMMPTNFYAQHQFIPLVRKVLAPEGKDVLAVE